MLLPCPYCFLTDVVVKSGFFEGKSGFRSRVQRYLCRGCGRKFSAQTTDLSYRQRKPYVDQVLFQLHASGMSERRCARILEVTRQTVARKIQRLGGFARLALARENRKVPAGSVVAFDEMETFEHTKMKPISIPLAVHKRTRRILAIDVASMPAKGPLAERARRKYGKRRDGRKAALRGILREVSIACPHLRVVESDECPRYPRLVQEAFHSITHNRYKGRRGCVVGQGELKAGGFDPLFSLNHTCAMLRDNLKTLSRRTWCTTKKIERLGARLNLYAWYHNQLLTGRKAPPKVPSSPMKEAS